MTGRPWLTLFASALGATLAACGDAPAPAVTAVASREVSGWDAAAAPAVSTPLPEAGSDSPAAPAPSESTSAEASAAPSASVPPPPAPPIAAAHLASFITRVVARPPQPSPPAPPPDPCKTNRNSLACRGNAICGAPAPRMQPEVTVPPFNYVADVGLAPRSGIAGDQLTLAQAAIARTKRMAQVCARRSEQRSALVRVDVESSDASARPAFSISAGGLSPVFAQCLMQTLRATDAFGGDATPQTLTIQIALRATPSR